MYIYAATHVVSLQTTFLRHTWRTVSAPGAIMKLVDVLGVLGFGVFAYASYRWIRWTERRTQLQLSEWREWLEQHALPREVVEARLARVEAFLRNRGRRPLSPSDLVLEATDCLENAVGEYLRETRNGSGGERSLCE